MPLNPGIDDLIRARQVMPVERTPSPVEQPPQSNMFAELLAQISGANPNWAYDDAQVSQLDDAFRQQFEQQQSPYAPPPQQMPATAATAIGGSQVPGIPTATGGLDPARLGEVAEARRLQAERAQGIPRIPTATPGMNRPAFDVPVQQMPRSQRMGKPMSPMFDGPQRHPGMMTQRQPLQQRPIQQQAPRSGSGTWAGHVNAGSRNIGSSRMPNTGREISSFGGQRQPNQPGMPRQPGMFGGPGQPGMSGSQRQGGFLTNLEGARSGERPIFAPPSTPPPAQSPMFLGGVPPATNSSFGSNQPRQRSNRRPPLDQYGGYGP